MNKAIKAAISFPFGVLWFVFTMLVLAMLIIPQVVVQAYGKNVDWISEFADFSDEVFIHFKEL